MHKPLEDRIRDHDPIEHWCSECSTTTPQHYEEINEPQYEDAYTYRCEDCRTVRYYEIREHP